MTHEEEIAKLKEDVRLLKAMLQEFYDVAHEHDNAHAFQSVRDKVLWPWKWPKNEESDSEAAEHLQRRVRERWIPAQLGERGRDAMTRQLAAEQRGA